VQEHKSSNEGVENNTLRSEQHEQDPNCRCAILLLVQLHPAVGNSAKQLGIAGLGIILPVAIRRWSRCLTDGLHCKTYGELVVLCEQSLGDSLERLAVSVVGLIEFIREELACLPVLVGEAKTIQRLLQDSYLCFLLRNFLSHPRLVIHLLANHAATDPK
jgi:hypothetical protein